MRACLTKAIRVLEVSRAALVAGAAGKVALAPTPSRRLAHQRNAAVFTAAARFAVRVAVVAGNALIASGAAVALLAETLT